MIIDCCPEIKMTSYYVMIDVSCRRVYSNLAVEICGREETMSQKGGHQWIHSRGWPTSFRIKNSTWVHTMENIDPSNVHSKMRLATGKMVGALFC